MNADSSDPDCVIAGASVAERFEAVNYAVDSLKTGANTSVYLDATHSGWQNVGNMTARLFRGGLLQADGFYLNASNYQFTANQVAYGTWISDCMALAEAASPSDPATWAETPGNCSNQYWNAGPATGGYLPGISGGLDNLVEWSSRPFDNPSNPTPEELASLSGNTAGIDSNSANQLQAAGVTATTHFVIDTSRNGKGPWDWAAAGYPDAGTAQDWCNPPSAGIGIEPTTDTGNALVDAFLWLKVPGESDGQCDRGDGNGLDEVWNSITDPAAGGWFAQQAALLIANANPALTKTAPTPTAAPTIPEITAGGATVHSNQSLAPMTLGAFVILLAAAAVLRRTYRRDHSQ